MPPEWVQDRKRGGDGVRIEWKIPEVNTRAVSRGQNEMIGKLKIVACDVISFRGRLWSNCTFQRH